ncbi:MAG: ABC transporter ATP-binding protein [Planctomycetota bacterium]|nr:ABC transporter ATP-binding protein [Planctomycetota bacterium]
MSGRSHIIQARGVWFAYRPGRNVLGGVDFTARAGRLVCILGPNGSGKTTLLRCLLGLLKPNEGEILLDGRRPSAHTARRLARLIAYVPQFPQSAFSFTVQQLILMGRFAHVGALGMVGEQDLSVAKLAMRMTDTLAFADRALSELSGGEQQRVMIARTLAQQPQLMLLDEPTSHLDIKNQVIIYRMMQRLAHDWELAVVCVSHDVNLAGRFADELVLMRSGKIIAAGPPGEVMREDLLAETYGVEIDLIPGADDTAPIVRVR